MSSWLTGWLPSILGAGKADKPGELTVEEKKIAELISHKNSDQLGKESDPDDSLEKSFCLFELDKTHLKEEVKELTESLNIGANPSKLMNIYEKTSISCIELDMWQTWSSQFSSKQSLRAPLQTIVDYAQNSKVTKAKGTVDKLRYITAKLEEKEYKLARAGIIILLAAHGGVCNVQKEVGITMAYASLTNSLKEELEKQSIHSTVLRLLRDMREQIVEQMFMNTGQFVNTHPLTGYRNGIAPQVGLHIIPDEHTSTQKPNETTIEEFFTQYSPKEITQMLSKSMNQQPRRVAYKISLGAFEKYCPSKIDVYDFLDQVFDSDGNFRDIAILFLLQKLKILKLKKRKEKLNFPLVKEKTCCEVKTEHDDVVCGEVKIGEKDIHETSETLGISENGDFCETATSILHDSNTSKLADGKQKDTSNKKQKQKKKRKHSKLLKQNRRRNSRMDSEISQESEGIISINFGDDDTQQSCIDSVTEKLPIKWLSNCVVC